LSDGRTAYWHVPWTSVFSKVVKKTTGRRSFATRSGFRVIAGLAVASLITGCEPAPAIPPGTRALTVDVERCRLVDTRPAPDTVGDRDTPLGSDERLTITAAGDGSLCDVPAEALAVTVEVSVFDAPTSGGVTLWAGGGIRPDPQMLWSAESPPETTTIETGLSDEDTFTLRAAIGPVDVAVDVVSYAFDLDDRYYTVDEIDALLADLTSFYTGVDPRGIAFDGQHIWTTNSADDTVTRIDVETGARADFPVGQYPFGIVFDGEWVWVANRDGNSVSRIDPASGASNEYGGFAGPYGVGFDGQKIWVTNSQWDTVSTVNRTTGAKIATYTSLFDPFAFAFDGEHMWVTNWQGDTVSRFDIQDGTRVDVTVGLEPYGIVFDGTAIWVTNWESSTLSRVDVDALTVTTYPTAFSPRGIGFDGRCLWVSSYATGQISRVDPATGEHATSPIGSAPRGIAFDGEHIWVELGNAARVVRLLP